jgi:Flp pilus assembly protein TadD
MQRDICLLWLTISFLLASPLFGEGYKGLNPSTEPALAACERGAALLKSGQTVQASEEFKKALRLNPRLAEARNGLGNALVKQGKPLDATEQFREAVRLRPDYAEAHFNLAVTLSQLGDEDAAIAEYRAAIGTGHADAEAHSNLGLLLWKENDLNRAKTELRAARDLNPRSSSIHINLGLLLEQLRDADGARAEFQKALQLDPASAKPAIELAILERQRGDIDSAEALLRKAIRVQPKNADAHYELGAILQSKGAHRAALKEFRATLLLDPNHSAAQYNLNRALAQIGGPKVSAEREHMRSGEEKTQRRERATLADARGLQLAKRGDLDQARSAFLEAQTLDPVRAEYFYNLGVLELSRNDWQAAEAQFRAALKLKTFYPDAHNNVGLALWREGKREAAATELREALRERPTAAAYENLGLLLEKMGDPDAIRFLKQADIMRKAQPAANAR